MTALPNFDEFSENFERSFPIFAIIYEVPLKSDDFQKKRKIVFQKRGWEGGRGQRLFGVFPKSHPDLGVWLSLRLHNVCAHASPFQGIVKMQALQINWVSRILGRTRQMPKNSFLQKSPTYLFLCIQMSSQSSLATRWTKSPIHLAPIYPPPKTWK